MKKIIFSISTFFGVLMQASAQVGGTLPTPPTPPTPQVESYSNSTSRSTTTTRHRSTKNGKTETFTETYTTSTPQQGQYDDPQRTKSFSKSYGLGRGEKVNISNIYGNLIVKTWDKNEVKVDADIRAFANSEDEAQKLIDNVSISSSKNGDEAVFKTQMEDRNGNWGNGSRNGKRWRREVKIFMTVYLPSSAALTASQQYGNVELPDFSGPTSLRVQYGKLITGNLSNINNFISAQYTSVDLQDVNKATIKQQYGSGLTIASIGDLNLNAQYATVRIGDVKRNASIRQQYGSGLTIASVGGNLDLDAQYASVKVGAIKGDAGIKIQYGSGLNIEQVDNLSLTAQYAAVRVGRLTGNMTAKGQYGSRLSVEKVEASSKIVNIDAQYLSVMLGFASNYGGSLNVDTQYGSLKVGEGINARRVGDDDDRGSSSRKDYTGTIGRGGASNVKVSVRYNSATLRVN
ncbi:MAG: hypothetical protein REI64_09475 [Pedobacter sp.]|uniref:hypothetical protein n=1 Tax=Pedobacter sp. TaxID=1411316 RepID=UPI0028095686|nr:hypothetical protein [Pedobacter sp.]MDQ8005015.1 hypothetical protein [Pedobacter sp.]